MTTPLALYGVGPEMDRAFRMQVQNGRFLPPDDPRTARPFVVLGHKVRQELFPGRNPLGERVQIGNQPARVIGVMESKGQILGFDMDDTVYIPAVRALDLFNRDGLMEIDLARQAGERQVAQKAVAPRVKPLQHVERRSVVTRPEDPAQHVGPRQRNAPQAPREGVAHLAPPRVEPPTHPVAVERRNVGTAACRDDRSE